MCRLHWSLLLIFLRQFEWFQGDLTNHCERMKNLTDGKAELLMLRKSFLFVMRKGQWSLHTWETQNQINQTYKTANYTTM